MVPALSCLFIFGGLPSFISGALYFLLGDQKKKKKINHFILDEVKVED
jgi:hypothetical protein